MTWITMTSVSRIPAHQWEKKKAEADFGVELKVQI